MGTVLANKKVISVGVAALAVLAGLYLANKVVSTTPVSDAQSVSQYKVLDYSTDMSNATASGIQAMLNQNAADGWRLVAADSQFLILGK